MNEVRYSRQMLFRPIGPSGQARLQASRVAVVGLGALGTVLATELVRAGVGFTRLIDRDVVEMSNLQRQSLYDEVDAAEGRAKAEAAAERLRQANADVEIEPVVADLNWRNAEQWLTDVDVILDGTDNFEVRYLINDVAVKHRIPWVYGGAVSSFGTMAFLNPGDTPCLVCLFGADRSGGGTDTCDTVGVIAPVVAIVASYQVAETLKFLTGNDQHLHRSMLYVDVWNNEFQRLQMGERNPECPCCGQRLFAHLNVQADSLTVSLCGRRTIQVRPSQEWTVPMERMAERLRPFGQVRFTGSLLRCEFDDWQLTLFSDGRALLHGVEDVARARSLYARYVGM
ncbi:MAG: ThiF family adenylyltransferase [Alicyclobacillus sp.]|nr:ThiF family adenylyltransferase [Alicyclobacillus sp.]